jgi:hypothetical protein
MYGLNLDIFFFIVYILASIPFIFRKLNYSILEKFLLGFVTSFLTYNILFFVISYFLGISNAYIYITALLTIAISIVVNLPISKPNIEIKEEIIPFVLILFLFTVFSLRFYSFSPIYYEFDPYFYLDGVKYLLKYGVIPMEDDSAWYIPEKENVSSHRNPPLYHYLITAWYYKTFGSNIDNINLPYIANFYPPLVAVMLIISIYLIAFEILKNRIVALSFAIFTSYLPLFVFKFMSGVFEIQPYNFMIMAYSLLGFLIGLVYKDPLFLSIGLSANILGTVSSQITSFLIFLSSILAFLKREDISNVLITAGIVALASSIILYLYNGSFTRILLNSLFIAIGIAMKMNFINLIKSNPKISIAMIILLSIIPVYLFIDNIFTAIRYNNPLERTIAEQTPSGASLEDNIGNLGFNLKQNNIAYILLLPFSLFSELLNLLIYSIISIFELLFGTTFEFIPKEPSIGYGLIFLAILLYILETRELLMKENASNAYIISLPSLIFLGGLIKAKFEIYFTFGSILILLYILHKFQSLIKHDKAPIMLSIFILLVSGLPGLGFADSFRASILSIYPSPPNDPNKLAEVKEYLCKQGLEEYCKNELEIYERYSRYVCIGYNLKENLNSTAHLFLAQIGCNYMPREWYEPMAFLRGLNKTVRVTSWWDYGHWINYWADQKAVIRNDHARLDMILDVAYAFIRGNEKVLSEIMDKYDSEYVLFDREIIYGGDIFGGKFYALNYLSCAKTGETNEAYQGMNSLCEYKNLWETIILSNKRCKVGDIDGIVGYVYEYKGYIGKINPELKEEYCIVKNPGVFKPLDIKTPELLLYLKQILLTNYVAYKNGKLHKAILVPIQNNAFIAYYTKDKVWFENGQWVDGYSDRTTSFYNSTLYKGFILRELEGFDLVFDNFYVKIYRRSSIR